MNWKQSFKFFKKHLWRKEAVAAILDLIQLSSESLWQLSKLLKVFLSHSESQEYFQTGFKNWILYYKSSIRYSFYERAGPNRELQAGVIARFSFLRGHYQTPDLQGRLQAKEEPDSNPGPQWRLHRSPPGTTNWKRKNFPRSGIFNYCLKCDRAASWSTIFDDRALLFGAYQFAPILKKRKKKKKNKESVVHTKDN